MHIMSTAKCKELDKYAIEKLEFPSIILMENAANNVCHEIKDKSESFLIICGTGNNGGDGLAIARKLILANKKVYTVIIAPTDSRTDDFEINYKMLISMTTNIMFIKNSYEINKLIEFENKIGVIVDCIFGVGLNRALDEFYIEVITTINSLDKKIIAIDAPSGLDCNTGKALGGAIKADITYSFEVVKRGFINYSAFEYIGDLKVIPIGIPEVVKRKVNDRIYILDKDKYSDVLIKRKPYGHKGDYGRVIIFAGSLGLTGASYITTEACVKAGAGLTTLVTSEECQKILSTSLIEAMTVNYNQKEHIIQLIENADVIAFGPGIDKTIQSEELLLWICENSKCTMVIDAEGVNILGRRRDILDKLKGRVVLTPHPGEMATLINKTVDEIEEDRVKVVKEFSEKYQAIILLKGYNTVISDGEDVYINTTGNSKMASGGMGDCLTGIIASLIAQGHNSLNGVLLGAYIHGMTGDKLSQDRYSIIATDIIDNLSFTMNELIKI